MRALKEKLSAASVLTVGDVMLDRYWFGDVERISPEAPVPVVRVTREEFRLGGAANVAMNVASLGARSRLLSIAGGDEPAETLRGLLADSGIDAHLVLDPDLQTTVKLRISGRAQQLLRVDFEATPQTDTLRALSTRFSADVAIADAVVLSDYGKGGLNRVTGLIAAARAHGTPVLVDPKSDDFAIYRGATVVTPNRAELVRVIGQWSDDIDLERRAQALRERLDITALLVTRSEEGMSLFDGHGHLRVTATAREVFDVTGAGDTVIATLGTMLACGMSLRDAVPIANRAGGLVVGHFGTAAITYRELFE